MEEIFVKIQRDSVLSSGRKSRYCDHRGKAAQQALKNR